MVVEELLGLSGPVHHLIIDAGDVENQPHHQTETCTATHHNDSDSDSRERETESETGRERDSHRRRTIPINKSKQHNK